MNAAELFPQYEKMLHKRARKFYRQLEQFGSSVSYEDLFQEASVTLVLAARGFDPDKGVKFSTYLWRAIDQNLIRFVQGEVYLSRPGSLDTEISNNADVDGGKSSLYDLLADENAEAGEQTCILRDEVRHRLSKLSPEARGVLLMLEDPCPELRAEMARQKAFAQRCVDFGYARPRVKLDVNLICKALRYGDRMRRSIQRELKDLAYG